MKECLISFRRLSLAAEELNMRVVYPRCCGVDVHKDNLTATVLVFNEDGGCQVRRKEYATHKKALANFRTWLAQLKVTHVAMESTGVYWIPI